MFKKFLVLPAIFAVLLATLAVEPSIAHAESTKLSFSLENNTHKPVEYRLQGGSQQSGIIQPGQTVKLNTYQTAYIYKHHKVSYELSLDWGNDNEATWKINTNNFCLVSPMFTEFKGWLEHSNVPFGLFSLSRRVINRGDIDIYIGVKPRDISPD